MSLTYFGPALVSGSPAPCGTIHPAEQRARAAQRLTEEDRLGRLRTSEREAEHPISIFFGVSGLLSMQSPCPNFTRAAATIPTPDQLCAFPGL